jgi:hypothetical protein
MSYRADSRKKFGVKKCDGAPGNFACAQLVSAEDFRVRRGKNWHISYSRIARARAPQQSANSRQEKFSSQVFIGARGREPGRLSSDLHVGEPRRLTGIFSCLYGRSNPFAEWMRFCQTTAYVLLRRCLASLSACVWRSSPSGILFRGFRGDG